MDNSDQTSAVAAGEADAGGSPALMDIINGAGASAAQGALDQVSGAIPDLSSSAGAGFAQGVLDTITPYLPLVLIFGAVALVMLSRR